MVGITIKYLPNRYGLQLVEIQDNGVTFFQSHRLQLTATKPFVKVYDDSQLVSLVLGKHCPRTSETCIHMDGESFIYIRDFKIGTTSKRCFIAADD